jgi:choline dehydrogenase-like flavoprotein
MINVLTTPFSRGSVRLSSPDPLAPPIINPGIFSSSVDKELLYACIRNTTLAITEVATPLYGAEEYGIDEQWRGIVTDEGIRARILNTVDTINHGSGTCAMGRVVDTECKVKGLQGLRVIDASILPFPMGSHYQAVVYGLAEQVSNSIPFLDLINNIIRWPMSLHC